MRSRFNTSVFITQATAIYYCNRGQRYLVSYFLPNATKLTKYCESVNGYHYNIYLSYYVFKIFMTNDDWLVLYQNEGHCAKIFFKWCYDEKECIWLHKTTSLTLDRIEFHVSITKLYILTWHFNKQQLFFIFFRTYTSASHIHHNFHHNKIMFVSN